MLIIQESRLCHKQLDVNPTKRVARSGNKVYDTKN